MSKNGVCTASSCLEDKIVPSKHQVYKGQLMYDCNTPASNRVVNFLSVQDYKGVNKWNEYVTTDSNGYFKFINKHSYNVGSIGLKGQGQCLTHLPQKEVNDLGKVYTSGQTISFVRRLKVKAILYTKENRKITNSEYQELNDCSRNTASNDLAELVEKELLKPSGQKGAGAFYTLN